MSLRHRVPVSTIMTKNIISLKSTDELATAERLFKEHNIRHIPVVEGDKIIGILSLTDLLRISFADGAYEEETSVETTVYNMFSISQVMAKKLKSVSSDTTIKEVAEILSEKEFHALPVVDNNKLVGIVTTTDLIKYLFETNCFLLNIYGRQYLAWLLLAFGFSIGITWFWICIDSAWDPVFIHLIIIFLIMNFMKVKVLFLLQFFSKLDITNNLQKEIL